MVEAEQAVLEERESTEVEEYRESLQRLHSDFVNYKRRVERERDEYVRSANEELILKLLPVLDDFGRALNNLPAEVADTEWSEGMALMERRLRAILGEEGLSRINAKGKEFNPWEHEAVFTEEGAEGEQGKVKSVIRDGYRLHDKVIRPTQVSVIKGVKPGPEAKHNIPIRRGGDVRWRGSRVAPGVREMFF